MLSFNLNERQLKAITCLKSKSRLTNLGYQQITDAARKTAARDLGGLVEKGMIELKGEKRSSHYVLKGKG
jgi:predicted HTH transcriptional regulator